MAAGIPLTRRDFLRLALAGGWAAASPWLAACGGGPGGGAAAAVGPARFFTAAERRALEALAGALIPDDQTAGALGTDAPEYIDRFLAAFDNPLPDLYRSGPASDRNPVPDAATGEPTGAFGPNRFEEILPLTRMQEAAFRILLYGSKAVPGGDVNDALLGEWPGLRTLYRASLADLEARARDLGAASLADLSGDALLALFDGAPEAFREALVTHLIEGMFCAPEYGGNRGLRGWRDYHYDGDSQPLGYSLFDRRTQTLRDRPDKPNQTIDPTDPAAAKGAADAFTPEVLATLEALVSARGGERFF